MRLGQIRWNNQLMAAIFDGGGARPIPDHTFYDLLLRAEVEKVPLKELALSQASSQHVQTPPVMPIHPREVWACGCTFQTNVQFRDAEKGTREGIYAQVFEADRPYLSFKGTARVCVGLNKRIGIRPDAKITVPEPELAVVLGKNGHVVGYTLANDVSARDIGLENPLYLPQSKIYTGCCALGPVIVTTDELTDPYNLEMSCTITRGEETVFAGGVNTAQLARKIEYYIDYLMRSNPVPTGSALLMGTGIVVPDAAALQPGDVVSIRVPEIGELRNTAALV